MKPGKKAGPGGSPKDLYKKCKTKLLTSLLEMFLYRFRNETLPPYMNGALNILLPKPEKPPNKCENVRPKRLLNSDLKILCKILAKREQNLMPEIIDLKVLKRSKICIYEILIL